MSDALLGLGLLVALGLALAWLRAQHLRARALARLEASRPAAPEDTLPEAPEPRPVFVRRRWIVAVVALGLGLGLWLGGVVRPGFALAAAAVVGTVGWMLESTLHVRRVRLLETQLTDSLDLVVGALRAGAGLLDALEVAAREARAPLRPLLEETCGRIRLGDGPQVVFLDLAERVPLESYQVLAFTLAVHWEVGGSLAPTLSTTGRAIRDRVELTRRVEAQSTQARVSAAVFLCLSVFVGLLVWRGNPARMEGFLSTSIGGGLVASAVVLQCLGVLWMARLSRLEV